MAVAEKLLDFEHRDLHWGNLLISKTVDKQLSYKIKNKSIFLNTKGVKVRVDQFQNKKLSKEFESIFIFAGFSN